MISMAFEHLKTDGPLIGMESCLLPGAPRQQSVQQQICFYLRVVAFPVCYRVGSICVSQNKDATHHKNDSPLNPLINLARDATRTLVPYLCYVFVLITLVAFQPTCLSPFSLHLKCRITSHCICEDIEACCCQAAFPNPEDWTLLLLVSKESTVFQMPGFDSSFLVVWQ